jgi:hypothetical protein
MLETDPIETVDAEPVLALDTPLTGLTTLPAPAAVIALYVTSLAKRGLAVSTIRRRRAPRPAG